MPLKIVFYGTPEFAVASLEALHTNDINIAAVVTSPDKPSGRGQRITVSPVKEFAVKNNLPILQPSNLKDESFLNQLKAINPDLQIVVAFRMMPEAVWKLPRLGTFNLHASLLPQYRGAAPINWAIINGEKETGVTTFFLKQEIDTGSIIFQQKINIDDNDTAGTLHDKLKTIGADLAVKTVEAIENNNYKTTEQSKIATTDLKAAPKLNKQNTKINFSQKPDAIRNFIRGLSPYPGAIAELYSPSTYLSLMLKIFSVESQPMAHEEPTGTVDTDHKSTIRVFVSDGVIYIKELQVANRSRMSVKDFLNGFKLDGEWVMK